MRRTTPARIGAWAGALGWTALCAYLLLWPAEETTVEDVSKAFGGTDLTDAIGHGGLLFGEAALLFILLCHYLPPPRARRWATGSAILFGATLEVAQHWIPGRGFAWLDISANALGPLLFAALAARSCSAR